MIRFVALAILLFACRAQADFVLSGQANRSLELLYDVPSGQIVVFDSKCKPLPAVSKTGRMKLACDSASNSIKYSIDGSSWAGIGTGAGGAAGGPNAVQINNGGLLADSGCTSPSGNLSCNTITSVDQNTSGVNMLQLLGNASGIVPATDCATNGGTKRITILSPTKTNTDSARTLQTCFGTTAGPVLNPTTSSNITTAPAAGIAACGDDRHTCQVTIDASGVISLNSITISGIATTTTVSTSTSITTTTSTSTTTSTVAASGVAATDFCTGSGSHAVACWKLEENQASRVNSAAATSCGGTAANCNLAQQSGTYNNDTTNFVEATASALFAGTGNGLGVTQSALSTANFTYVNWIRQTATTSNNTFANNTDFNTKGWIGYLTVSGGTTLVSAKVWGGGTLQAAASVPQNTWEHLAYSSTANAQKLYENGGTPVTSSDTFTPDGASDGFNVGAYGQVMNGNIDDAAYYSVALTAQQICYICALNNHGTKGWCDSSTPANYRTCTTDADCNGITGACDTTDGLCIGRLHHGTPNCTQLSGCGTALVGCTAGSDCLTKAQTAMGNCNQSAP